jgi:hypothetical protein
MPFVSPSCRPQGLVEGGTALPHTMAAAGGLTALLSLLGLAGARGRAGGVLAAYSACVGLLLAIQVATTLFGQDLPVVITGTFGPQIWVLYR